MKTLEQFRELVPEFYHTINGKVGADFFHAVEKFMEDNGFEQHVHRRIFENDKLRLTLFSDNYVNNAGILFGEIFDKRGFCKACTLTEARTFILDNLEFIKEIIEK